MQSEKVERTHHKYADIAKKRLLNQRVVGFIFILYVIAGFVYPYLGYFIPLCMLFGIGTALAKGGRKWCDWWCLRGSFLDAYLRPVSAGRSIPDALKKTSVRIGVLLFLMTMMTIQIVRLWPDAAAIGGFFMILLTVTTVIGIFLGVFIHQRSWCYICPIGSLSNWATRARIRMTINSEQCNGCGACGKVCPMQITAAAFKERGVRPMTAGDCLQCGLCPAVCPTKALTLSR